MLYRTLVDSYMKTSPEGSFIVLGAPRANGFVFSLQRDAKLDTVLMLLAALAASYIPARRAVSLDPLAALGQE